MDMKQRLKDFLQPYVGQGVLKKDIVHQDDIDCLIYHAIYDGIEQDIIDYGTENPDAPFWDFFEMVKPGLKDGVTQEELLRDDDED